MLDAAFRALFDLVSPPFRAVLWKSIGLAVVLLVVIGIGLQRLLAALLRSGAAWLETSFGASYHGVVAWSETIIAVLAGLGVIVGLVFLMPAVTALVASFFADTIAEHVERTHYPADPPGKALPLGSAVVQGIAAALLAVLVYLCAVPFLLVAGFGAIIFFFATAFILGREYFLLAAMRFRPPADAKALRREHATAVFLAGLLIAAFVSIPIVNLATPLFAMAFMVHVHKRIAPSGRTLIEPALARQSLELR